jgi:hypothetical protein
MLPHEKNKGRLQEQITLAYQWPKNFNCQQKQIICEIFKTPHEILQRRIQIVQKSFKPPTQKNRAKLFPRANQTISK